MNRFFLTASLALAGATCAFASDNAPIILDLSKASTELSFNPDNGSWTGTYDDDAETIDSQCFSFIHSSMSDWMTWWGFTASNSADNRQTTNTLSRQWSNMAAGGIALNEDGSVKLDSFGAPVVSTEIPYLVAFYSPFMSAKPTYMLFKDGKSYEAVSVYVNLTSYTYYSVVDGDSFARAFTNGDDFSLTIHGVAPDGSEKAVEVSLASGCNGDLTTARGWKFVDISSLGIVNELYFTLSSTDSSAYGANTPLYFCLDKLCVRPVAGTDTNMTVAGAPAIRYDRATKTVFLTDTDFAVVYDSTGTKVMTWEGNAFSTASLAPGVYVIRSGNANLKIAR